MGSLHLATSSQNIHLISDSEKGKNEDYKKSKILHNHHVQEDEMRVLSIIIFDRKYYMYKKNSNKHFKENEITCIARMTTTIFFISFLFSFSLVDNAFNSKRLIIHFQQALFLIKSNWKGKWLPSKFQSSKRSICSMIKMKPCKGICHVQISDISVKILLSIPILWSFMITDVAISKNQSLLATARTILQSILHINLAPTTAISNHMKKGTICVVTEFSNWNQTSDLYNLLLSTSKALPFGWKNKSQNNY